MATGEAEHTPPEAPESSSPGPSGPDIGSGAQNPLVDALGVAPPVAAVVAVAAVIHIFAKRVVLPGIIGQGAVVPQWLTTIPSLTLNVAALGSLVALTLATIEICRYPDFTHGSRRVLIGALASIVIVVSTFATFVPEGVFAANWVMMTAFAVHALAVQLAMAAMRQHGSLAGRTTAALAAAASVFPLASILVKGFAPLAGSASLHGLGELAYLLTPIAAAFCIVPWGEDPPAVKARRAGAAAVFVMGLMFAAASRLPSEDYGHLLYSTLRLEWALEKASLGYAVPISLAAGGATAALLSPDARHRQGGLGIWLLLSAGYNPLSPGRLLLWSLCVTLLSRALISLRFEREGTGATEAV